jgi:ribosomal protein S18 acetylase RimI-like enzyme
MPKAARIVRLTSAVARAQAAWIVALEPWRGLGYRAEALGRYLARKARSGAVWAARTSPHGPPLGVVVADDGVLLGAFIALLAVRPAAGGQGLGRRLVDHVAARTFAKRRWLYTSADGKNVAALRFYRRLGFARVGRLPDLVRSGRVEILLRKAAPPEGLGEGQGRPRRRRARTITKIPTPAPGVGYHQGAS